jgi:excisionase family DNA binding protein
MIPDLAAQIITDESPGLSLERLYRPEDVARQLGIGRSFVWRLMKNGSLPYCHIGRFRRISGATVSRYIAARHASEIAARAREASC